jgi:hypothetical protein
MAQTAQTKWEEKVKELESTSLNRDITDVGQRRVFYARVFELAKEVLGDGEFPGITFRISVGQIINRIMLGAIRLPQPPNCKRVPIDSEGVSEREKNVVHAIDWAKSYSRFSR